MTPAERILLQRLPYAFSETRGRAMDTQAGATLVETLQSDPDALYALIEHTLLTDRALQAAQAKAAMLEEQLHKVASAMWPGIVPGGQATWNPPASLVGDWSLSEPTPAYRGGRSFAPSVGSAGFARDAGGPATSAGASPQPFSERPRPGSLADLKEKRVTDEDDDDFSDLQFEDGLGGGY